MGEPPDVVPDRRLEEVLGARLRLAHDVVPAAEAGLCEQRNGEEELRAGRRLDLVGTHLEPHLVAQFVGLLKRHGAPALELGRGPGEVNVVLIGTGRIAALLIGHPQIELVHRRGVQIEVRRFVVVTGLDQDVRAHVNEVGGARHGPGQVSRVGNRAREIVGRLHSVDVEVDGAGVVRIHGESAFDLPHQPVSPIVQGLSFIVPVVPTRGVHVGGGGEHLQIDVLGVGLGERASLLVVRLVERVALRGGIFGITGGKRLDHGLFLLGGRPRTTPGPG